MSTPVAFLGAVHVCPTLNSPAAHLARVGFAVSPYDYVNDQPMATAGYIAPYGPHPIVVGNPAKLVGE